MSDRVLVKLKQKLIQAGAGSMRSYIYIYIYIYKLINTVRKKEELSQVKFNRSSEKRYARIHLLL